MKLLALDQASKVSGFSVFEDGKLIASGTFTAADDDIGVRLVNIRNKVIELIEKYSIDEVAFEDIQMQSQVNNVQTHKVLAETYGQSQVNNVQTYKVLAEVYGVIEELLSEKKIKYYIVHSQTWKSTLHITGKNRPEQKRNAQKFVAETYGLKVTQDESDAICIGTHITRKNNSVFNWE